MENMILSSWKAFGQTMKHVSLLGYSFLAQPCIKWCFDLSTQLSREGKGGKLK